MKFSNTTIPGVYIIEPVVFGDHRGWFMETWSQAEFDKHGLNITFEQDNHSFSAQRGTLRGLHFQINPMAQSKLVRCTRGELLDVAVDIRKGSPTYKHWVAEVLSADNKKQLFIPKGFAHGFITLTDNVEIQYKVDALYSKEHDSGIAWNDPELGINWGVSEPILSEKDLKAPLLKDNNGNFSYNDYLER